MTVNTASTSTQETPKNPLNSNQEKMIEIQEVNTAGLGTSYIEVAVMLL